MVPEIHFTYIIIICFIWYKLHTFVRYCLSIKRCWNFNEMLLWISILRLWRVFREINPFFIIFTRQPTAVASWFRAYILERLYDWSCDISQPIITHFTSPSYDSLARRDKIGRRNNYSSSCFVFILSAFCLPNEHLPTGVKQEEIK